MSEKSSIKCELIFDEGLHQIELDGNIKELGYISILIINTLRREFMAAGYTDKQAKLMLVGGIEKFW